VSRRLLIVLFAALAAFALPGAGAAAQGHGSGGLVVHPVNHGLLGDYSAHSFFRAGERQRLLAGTRLEVSLRRERGLTRISWSAGCNHYSAWVRVHRKRLRLGPVSSTMIRCTPALVRQDDRLTSFFMADPRWRRHNGGLVLRAGERMLRLRPDVAGYGRGI
jgi:hypothetical protein